MCYIKESEQPKQLTNAPAPSKNKCGDETTLVSYIKIDIGNNYDKLISYWKQPNALDQNKYANCIYMHKDSKKYKQNFEEIIVEIWSYIKNNTKNKLKIKQNSHFSKYKSRDESESLKFKFNKAGNVIKSVMGYILNSDCSAKSGFIGDCLQVLLGSPKRECSRFWGNNLESYSCNVSFNTDDIECNLDKIEKIEKPSKDIPAIEPNNECVKNGGVLIGYYKSQYMFDQVRANALELNPEYIDFREKNGPNSYNCVLLKHRSDSIGISGNENEAFTYFFTIDGTAVSGKTNSTMVLDAVHPENTNVCPNYNKVGEWQGDAISMIDSAKFDQYVKEITGVKNFDLRKTVKKGGTDYFRADTEAWLYKVPSYKKMSLEIVSGN